MSDLQNLKERDVFVMQASQEKAVFYLWWEQGSKFN